MKNRTLALAGVFQSAELVRQAANHGTWSGYASSAMMRSLFILEPESIEDVYGDMDRMKVGVEVLMYWRHWVLTLTSLRNRLGIVSGRLALAFYLLPCCMVP